MEYSLPLLDLGELTLRADWYTQTSVWYDTLNRAKMEQNKYRLLNGRVTFRLADDKTEIAFWGRNLLDRTYNRAGSFGGDLFGHAVTTVGAPRRYGVEVKRSFGSY